MDRVLLKEQIIVWMLFRVGIVATMEGLKLSAFLVAFLVAAAVVDVVDASVKPEEIPFLPSGIILCY